MSWRGVDVVQAMLDQVACWRDGDCDRAGRALSAQNCWAQVTKLKPGEADDDLFLQHPSVASWRAWYFSDADYTSTPERCAQQAAARQPKLPACRVRRAMHVRSSGWGGC